MRVTQYCDIESQEPELRQLDVLVLAQRNPDANRESIDMERFPATLNPLA